MRSAWLIVPVFLFSAGCAGLRLTGSFRSAPDDWSMEGGSPDRRHHVADAPALPWARAWEYNAQGGILASPLVRDSIVIVGTLHGELQAVDLRSGRRVGYEKLGAPIHGTPALNGLTVIVPLSSENNSVIAFDLRDNRKIWQASVGPVEAGVLLDEDHVYVATLTGHVVCLDSHTGEEKWRFNIGTKTERKPIRTTPALGSGTLVVGCDDGTLAGIEAATGKQRWQVRSSSSYFAGPVIAGGVVVAGDLQGHLVAVDVVTGSVRWTANAGGPVYGSAASDGVTAYIPTAAGRLLALDVASGVERWSYRSTSVLNAPPVIAGDRILVGSLDRSLAILDAGSGSLIEKIIFEGRVKVSPVVWHGVVLVTYEDKYVAAYVHREPAP